MTRFHARMLLISTVLGLGLAPVVHAEGAAKKPAPAAKPAPSKKVVPVNAAHKKKLEELYVGFKFGMTKDEVIAEVSMQLSDFYADKFKGGDGDVAVQDRVRKDKAGEVSRFQASFVTLDMGKPSPWDGSIIEEEAAHGTGESLLERWENRNGKNQHRFFFFFDGKLWKMFVSLDVSLLPEDKRNFETFQELLQGQYGPGEVEPGKVTWRTEEFDVRVVDKLKSYGALGLTIESLKIRKDVMARRTEKAPHTMEPTR